ncbi:MAG: aminotransferase class IV [Acidimicrobiia bacterium]|jgi:branched-chain amino acid aminotransferase
MADELVWIDGALVPGPEARVSVFDHGITVGDGVFETLKAVDGVPFAVRRHLDRLRRSAAALGLMVPASDEELREAMAGVLEAVPRPLARVRITVTGGVGPLGSDRGSGRPTTIVAAADLAPPAPTTAVCTVPWPRNERGALVGVKSTSYAENVVALAHAKERGGSEALLPTTTGLLCEGTGSNVFLVLEGQLLTPSLASGCLAGVTRDLVIELTGAVEADVPMDDLHRADEVLLTSTGRDVQGVHRVDHRDLTAPGPVTRRAADALAELAATDVDP